MNGACPTCGAVYSVEPKDVGRRIRCKKCETALTVDPTGLVVDTAQPAPEPAVAERTGPRVPNFNLIARVGGAPTALFGFGVFLVIVFTAMPLIGIAGSDRASALVERLEFEKEVKLKALVPKGKRESDLRDAEKAKFNEEKKKLEEDYDKRIEDAKNDSRATKIGNRRDVWYERYGLMFGFVFVAFGCIAYLRSAEALVLRIVAAVILSVMMIVMFLTFGGCAVPKV
jgi:predicted Zn finger-like uncharacterized protein